MRIKYIKQVGFNFDVEYWMTGSGYIKGEEFRYYMKYRDLDCWELTLDQEDGKKEQFVVIKESINMYFIACEDDVLTEDYLKAFIHDMFDSVEYHEYYDVEESENERISDEP